ncbi:hypothetical protein [Adhaeretor mobilis]|uniref:Transmembrane protein n=1 Tax=Adhaeretor mobilis TaxID=1930276 RepID=A0A517N0Y6_9BACT|nr:hypothetical protein [Adhaeretor mobilis]QDT00796.1 hypothetical protein HG15A2_41380 [Adhaeretor mobilis]
MPSFNHNPFSPDLFNGDLSKSNSSEPPSDFAQLESIVRAAASYAQPTEDLRPRVIEAARDARRMQRLNRSLGSLSFAVLLAIIMGLPGYLAAAFPKVASADSEELHRRATHKVVKGSVDAPWALFEVFSDLRREQASRLPQAGSKPLK